jgi:hypothetical protein
MLVLIIRSAPYFEFGLVVIMVVVTVPFAGIDVFVVCEEGRKVRY